MALKRIRKAVFGIINRSKYPLIIGYFGSIHVMHDQLLTKYHNFNVLTFKHIPNKTSIYGYHDRIRNLSSYKPSHIYVLREKDLNYTSTEFINKFLKRLKPSKIIVGSDFVFGSDRASWLKLKEFFPVETVSYNKHISTTKIYEMLMSGQVEKANNFLVEPYYFKSKWIRGLKVGRRIGVKTINLKVDHLIYVPEGTYVTNIVIGKKKYQAITFLGESRTINHGYKTLETHIIDEGISNRVKLNIHTLKDIKVEFLKFIRKNKKFNNIVELPEQIKKDIEVAKLYFATCHK